MRTLYVTLEQYQKIVDNKLVDPDTLYIVPDENYDYELDEELLIDQYIE